MYCIMVVRPHISTDNGDMFFCCIRQLLQIGNDGWFVPISKQINNLAVLYICDDTTILMQQVQFINPDACALKGVGDLQVLCGLLEDETHKLFINAYIVSNTGKCSPQRLLSNVQHQTFRHEMVFVHIVQWLEEGFVALTATIPSSVNQDTRSFSSDWNIHKQLLFHFMAIELFVVTVKTTSRNSHLLCADLVIMFMLIHCQNMSVRPTQYIRKPLSEGKVLPKIFFSLAVITVARERRLLQAHATHFSDCYIKCRRLEGGQIPRTFPNSL